MGYLMFKFVKAWRMCSTYNSIYFSISSDPWNKVESAIYMSTQSLKPLQRGIDTSVFTQQLPPSVITRKGKGDKFEHLL